MNVKIRNTQLSRNALLTAGAFGFAILMVVTLFALQAITPFKTTVPEAHAWMCESMTATPSTVEAGASVTLEWSFGMYEEGVYVTIDQLPGQQWEGTSGSVEVFPTETTEYRAVAHKEGMPAIIFDCCVTVTVTPPVDPCEDVNLQLNEYSFTFSGPPALSHYRVDYCDGSEGDRIEGEWSDVETIHFNKEIQTVYANGGQCEIEQSRDCTPIEPAPTCELSANPGSITEGDSATITWSGQHVTHVDITNIGTGLASASSTVVSPLESTTYTGTFYGTDNTTVICEDTVTVEPVTPGPSCQLYADPESIVEGEDATLTWNSEHVSSVDITNIGTDLAVASSSTVTPATTTTYIGTFYTDSSETLTCEATVTVVPPSPTPTCDMVANPTTIEEGNAALISWDSEYVTSVDITHIGTGLASASTTSVSPATTTTYTGTFYTDSSETLTCEATVTVVPPQEEPQPVCAMSISPSKVNVNDAATLTWTSDDVVSASIDNSVGDVDVNGSTQIIVQENTTYTGTFIGEDDSEITCSASVSIKTGGGGMCLNCGNDDDDDDDDDEDDEEDPEPSIVLGKTTTKTGSFVTLNQVPYTGFKAGPLLTALFWLVVLLVSILIAYGVTYYKPLSRLQFALAHSKKTSTQTEYFNTPIAQSVVTEEPTEDANMHVHVATDMYSNQREEIGEIERMAHAENILLSPEALRLIQGELLKGDVSLTTYLSDLFTKAKTEFPREDGWILLSKERTEALTQPHTEMSKEGAQDEHGATKTQQNTNAQVEQQIRVENHDAPTSAVTPGAVQIKKQHEKTTTTQNAQNPSSGKNNVVAKFIEHLVRVQKKEAFDLLRTVSTRGIDAGTFMTLVVRQLDEVYRYRIEGMHIPNSELVSMTESWIAEDFETVLGILVECIDYSYSNNRTGTKIALAKAFDHFEKK